MLPCYIIIGMEPFFNFTFSSRKPMEDDIVDFKVRMGFRSRSQALRAMVALAIKLQPHIDDSDHLTLLIGGEAVHVKVPGPKDPE